MAIISPTGSTLASADSFETSSLDPVLFRRKMDEVVSTIPLHAIRPVLEAIDGAATANGERARHLRDALVEHFNRLRPMKARRLFTGLFEPFLVDDPVLYRAPAGVPGLIQRVDMGGLWAALSQMAFPGLAAEVQCRLDEMARGRILDEVLSGPEAMGLRDHMRRAAADFLVTLDRDFRLCSRFQMLANDEAEHDARLRTHYLNRKAPIDAEMLGFVRAVLENNAALLPLAERLRRDMDQISTTTPGPAVEEEGLSALMVGYARRVRDLGPAFRDQSRALAWVAPLYALNVKGRTDVFQRYVREHGGAAIDDQHPLRRALLAHFSASCTTIHEVVDGLFADIDMLDGGVLSLNRSARGLLTTAVERFERTLSAVSGTGILANRTSGPAIRTQLSDVTRRLTQMILPALAVRLQAAMNTRHHEAPDHDDVVWLLELVWHWGRNLGTVGYASPEIKSLRLFALEQGRVAFLQAMQVGDGDRAEARMAHLLRIRRLVAAIGEDITPWITPASPGLHRVVHTYLDSRDDIGAEEWVVIDGFAQSLRVELNRSRNWKSADHVATLRLHEERRGLPPPAECLGALSPL